MKFRRWLAPVLTLSAMLMLSTGTAHAGFYARHFTVYYACVVGPPPTGPVGEWDVDCDGNWSGWGNMPYTDCTTTEVTPTDYCGP